MSRRPALRAVTATAGIALVAVGGFGLLAQPHADAAPAQSSCGLLDLGCILGGSSSAAPSSSAPAGGGTSSPASGSTTTSPPASLPTDQSTPAVGDPATLYTQAATPQATQAATTGPAPGPNLSMSRVVIRKTGGKLDVLSTVTNTGTVLLQNVPISVRASGLGTQHWTITLNPGQRLSFHTRWPFRATPQTKKVVVTIDPQHLVAETNEADNQLTRTKRFG